MVLAVLLVFAQAASAAWAGARPAECAPLEGRAAANVWERAKSPALRRYCDLLAGGAAKLAVGSGPDEARLALALADEAAAALPDRAAPDVLRGRALARLARWPEATIALERARSRDPRALDDPAALFTWGRALARRGRLAEAEGAFRLLLPRAESLSPAERGAAGIEAALLAGARGPSGLDDEIAILRQAGHDARDALQGMITIALALALDRGDQRDEARLLLSGLGRVDPRVVLDDARVHEVLEDAGAAAEGEALVAFALEARDPQASSEAWARYLAGPGGRGPWAEHARRQMARGRGER